MKRDPNLFRKILLKCEELDTAYVPASLQFSIEGHSLEEVGFHVYLLGQAEFMEVLDVTSFDATSPQAVPSSITYAGYKFLDSIRDEEVWKTIKNIISKTGGWTVSVIASVATEIITRKAMAAIGP